MLIGYYNQKIDKKGRTALPAKFKKVLGEKVILSRWYETSLAIFLPADWSEIVNQATRGSSIRSVSRDTERFLLGGAYEIELDAQGRFVVPVSLRDYVEFGSEAVFVGLGNRVELWKKESWEKKEKEITKNAEKLLEESTKG